MKRPLAVFLLLLLATNAFAWGEKGHYIVNEAATHGLPAEMPAFFHQAYPELVWLGFEPDRWKSGGKTVDDGTSPNHFLDFEFVEGLKLPQSRHEYVDLMISSGRLRQKGLTSDEAGFLPWAIAEEAQKLTVQFRNWRSSQPGSSERANLERNIIHIAGVLGHYVADGANPHHATMNFNGWAEPNPNGYAIDCGTHSRFESAFVSRAVETRDVNPKLAAPVLRTDYFVTAVEHVKASNELVEQLYQIDRDGAFAPLAPIRGAGFEFATDRMAAGASLLRDIWWSAWKNSEKRPTRD